MLNKVLFIFFITFLFSCSTESKGELVPEDVILSTSNDVACNPQSNSNYIGDIKTGQIGIVSVGSQIPNLDAHIEYEIQSVNQIVPQEDGTEKQREIHHVYYNMTEVMFLEMEASDKEVIKSITTFSPSYYLDNCIHVGSSIELLQSKYQNFDVMLNYDDNMLYIINTDNSAIVFMLMADNIIDQTKVNQVDGQTSISNIDPKGVIMSIIVQN